MTDWEQFEADQRAATHAEYSQFEAVAPILYDGALAYNPGDPVPASNVERHDYLAQGLVKPVEPDESTEEKD